jgi:hypothetical protein
VEVGDGLRIEARTKELSSELMDGLRQGLERCPDLAFAHLPQVFVQGRQTEPELVLFVWLEPAALRSLRSALNLISETVAQVLPTSDYLDVVVLNSAPELLPLVERAGCLLVERNAEERRRALAAASDTEAPEPLTPGGRWWWPF